MKAIKSFEIINRPLPVVEKAITDGFAVYENSRNILNTKYDENHYSANLNPSLFPRDITDVSLTIQLMGRKNIGKQTYLASTIHFERTDKTLLNFVKCILLRFQIKTFAEMRLKDFKNRVEKWM